jgi:hypothetical protein
MGFHGWAADPNDLGNQQTQLGGRVIGAAQGVFEVHELSQAPAAC